MTTIEKCKNLKELKVVLYDTVQYVLHEEPKAWKLAVYAIVYPLGFIAYLVADIKRTFTKKTSK